jgi:hypothetical protein
MGLTRAFIGDSNSRASYQAATGIPHKTADTAYVGLCRAARGKKQCHRENQARNKNA